MKTINENVIISRKKQEISEYRYATKHALLLAERFLFYLWIVISKVLISTLYKYSEIYVR